MLLCIIVGGTMNNVTKFKEKFKKGAMPQFIYIDNELLMPMPDGSFIYFPIASPHQYLTQRGFEDKIMFAKKIYMAGSVTMPKQKC